MSKAEDRVEILTRKVIVKHIDFKGEYGKTETLRVTTELLCTIAHFNGYLSAYEVQEALLSGNPVYTEFRQYKLQSLKAEHGGTNERK